jgi:hypothetical protein
MRETKWKLVDYMVAIAIGWGQPIHYLPNLCLYRKYLKDQLCSFADNQLVGLSAQISGGRVIGSHRVDMASMMMTMIMML